jgi:hypothetical protein
MADEEEAEKIRESNRKAQAKIHEDPTRAQEKRDYFRELKEKKWQMKKKQKKFVNQIGKLKQKYMKIQ